MPVSVEKIWAAAQEMLRSMLNADIYNLWFAPLRAGVLEGDQITLEVANDFCEVWLKDNYLGLIQDVLLHASGQPLHVRFKIGAVPAAGTALTGDGKPARAAAVGPAPKRGRIAA